MSAKVLILDIETSPITTHTWGLWDQNIGVNQIVEDWNILCFSAKWLDSPKVLTYSLAGRPNPRDDKPLMRHLWQLLDDADVVVWQNGKAFDHKKINARFAINGLQPPSPYKQIDTKQLASKHFGFTSNKLEYLAKRLGLKNLKLTTRKFDGHSLWTECLKGNHAAWAEMHKYNELDVLATEELYKKLIPWDAGVNMSLYRKDDKHECTCGSTKLQKRGPYYTTQGVYQRYQCTSCGKWTYGGKNQYKGERQKGTQR